MKLSLAILLVLALPSCQFAEFLTSPTGKALTQTATTIIVSKAVESDPDLAITFEDLARNLEAEGSELSPDGIRAGLAAVPTPIPDTRSNK